MTAVTTARRKYGDGFATASEQKKEEEKEEKYVGEIYIQEKKAAGRVSQPSSGIEAD